MSSTVLITGAAAGIGRRAALDLAVGGHSIIAAGRGRTGLAVLAVGATAGRLQPVGVDLADTASVYAVAARVKELTDGREADVLEDCAGYAVAGPTSEVTDAGCLRISTPMSSASWR